MRATLIAATLLAAGIVSAQSAVVIRNVTVIDVASAQTLPAMTVVTRGSRIAKVSPSTPDVPKDAKIIDGTGKFLIPGLWDMHTHFTSDRSSLDLFIAYGVTGVRDMGSLAVKRTGDTVKFRPRDEAIREIVRTRDEVKKGRIQGPAIYTTGMIVTGPNPRNPSAPAAPHQIVVKNPAEARAAIRKLKRMKVDFIKVHARLSKESFFAIIDEAKRLQLPVVGHVPLSINPIDASRAGMKSIEHLTGVWEYAHKGLPDDSEEMDPERFNQEISEFRKNKTFQVPTLINYQAGAEGYRIVNNPDSEPALSYTVPELALRWMTEWTKTDFTPKMAKEFNDSVITLQDMTKRIAQGGVPIMAGTDCGGIFTYPGLSLHKELQLLSKGGLSPMQTLQAATIRPAQFLGIESKAGSISKGKIADLVLLSRNPLDDITNTESIHTVILRGKIIDHKKLLERVAKRSKPTRNLMKTGKWLPPR